MEIFVESEEGKASSLKYSLASVSNTKQGANKTIVNNYKETPEEVANGMVLAEEIRDWKS